MNVLFGVVNTWDSVIIAVFVVGLVIGLSKGVLNQIFTLGGLMCGLILGSKLYKSTSPFIQKIIDVQQSTAEILAFILILVLIPVICVIIGNLLSKLFHAVSWGAFDRIFGGLIGMFESLLCLGVVFMLTDMLGVTDKIRKGKIYEESSLFEPIYGASMVCLRWARDRVVSIKDSVVLETESDGKKG